MYYAISQLVLDVVGDFLSMCLLFLPSLLRLSHQLTSY